MIEMAIVGLGSWGLCVLERTVNQARRVGTPMRLHLVEPSQLGGVYTAAQPDFLVLNNACGQLSLYAAPDGDGLPPYAVGLHAWAVVRGYRWVGYECRIGVGGDPILPTDYLPRRLMGEYLVWFYDTLLAQAPPNLEIVRHYAAAVDISPVLQGREAVLLDNGTTLTVDHVVLTSGHTFNDEPGAGGGVHYLPPYPVEHFDQSAPAGSSVAMAGMGLACFDVLTALTIGRGGTFKDRCDRADRKRYVPSGREPTITLYSRSGAPYLAKAAHGVDPYGQYQPVVCTPEEFAALTNPGGSPVRRHVDFRKRKRRKVVQPVQRVMINERVCEGCGDCGAKSNCLSVQPIDTEFGRKTRIDQSSCNFDFSCLKGDCPAFMTIVPSRSSPAKVALRGLETADLPEPAPMAAVPHTTRITGIGGSGVVTVAQTLAAAATIAGRYVRTLDQTGIAQKGGPVVSDIKIFDESTAVANRVGEGECDLYLGCDLLVAAEARYLLAADPHRTVAVISSSAVPTGRMVVDPDTTFPAISQAVAPILEATRAERAVILDARELATALFGQDQFANMLLVGAAYQTGRLPLRAQHIEEAIRGGGIKVQQNLQAFRRGRQAVAAPADLDAAVAQLRKERRPKTMSHDARRIAAIVRAIPESPLGEDVAVRVSDLIAYQSRRYAQRYAEFVERIRVAEATMAPGLEDLTRSVARNLHKLMAYKDEYEVPRLCLGQEVDGRVREAFGPNARVSYKLHPPFLRAMGMNRKLTSGPRVRPFFRALATLRFLRGSFLDPFGHTQMRRLERQLIVEYRAWMDAVAVVMTPDNHSLAVRVAELPDIVRGYEDVKLANVARYRKQGEQLISELR